MKIAVVAIVVILSIALAVVLTLALTGWFCQEITPIPTPTPTQTPTLTPTTTPTVTVTPTPTISCDIQWNEAKYYIGEYMTVCGPVIDSHYASTSSGQPTFLNIGKDYPDLDRFTVVIWGDNRGNFPSPPEDYYLGKNIGVTGLITEYEGIAQIEVSTPSQIKEY